MKLPRKPALWIFLVVVAIRLLCSLCAPAKADDIPAAPPAGLLAYPQLQPGVVPTPVAAPIAPPAGSQAALAQTLYGGPTPPPLPNDGPASSIVLSSITSQAGSILGTVQKAANALFLGLVVLDLFWTVAQGVLGNGELGELMVQATQKIIVFNLIYWIFVVNGFGIASTIINSFFNLGNAVKGTVAGSFAAPTDPLAIIWLGVGIASPMIAEAIAFGAIPDEVLGNGATQLMSALIDIDVIGAALTVGGYAFLAGTITLAMVEAYIVTSAGIIVTGFLGSRWTISIGEKYFSYAVSVGVKLMVAYICVGVVAPLAPWIAGFGAIPAVGALVAGFLALIVAMIAFSAPQFAASIVGGSSNSSFGQFASTVAGAAAAGTALAGAAMKAGGAIHDKARALAAPAETIELPELPGGDGGTLPTTPAAATMFDPESGDGGGAPQWTPATPSGGPRPSGGGATPLGGGATPLRGASTRALRPGSPVSTSLDSSGGDSTVSSLSAQSNGSPATTESGLANPKNHKPIAYTMMDEKALKGAVTEQSIGKMSADQLRGVRRNPAFNSLDSDLRKQVTGGIRENRLALQQGVHDGIASAFATAAHAVPTEDGGATGAVSIRV